MGSIKFSLHPLFFPFGLYYALTGKIFIFIIYTLTALIHELGHSISASGRGYRLNKIELMPFGAIVSGDDGLSVKDEFFIAMAGPLTNVAIATTFVALWWLLPETYAFTDTVVQSNISMAVINLIPVYPLDGGRILYSFLANKKNKAFAKTVTKIISIVVAVMFSVLFVYSLFVKFNLSLLFFSLFLLWGAFAKKTDNTYIKLFSGVNRKKLKSGILIKRQAIAEDSTIKDLVKALDTDSINEITVLSGDGKTVFLSQDDVCDMIKSCPYTLKIKDGIKKMQENG